MNTNLERLEQRVRDLEDFSTNKGSGRSSLSAGYGSATNELQNKGISDLKKKLNELNKSRLPELDSRLARLQTTQSEPLADSLEELNEKLGELNGLQGTLSEQLSTLDSNLNNKLDSTPGVITETYIGDNEISVGKLKVNDIFSNEAVIAELTSQKGFFEELTASELWAQTGVFTDAFVDNITGNNAFFDNLTTNTAFVDTMAGKQAFFDAVITNDLWSDKVTSNQVWTDQAVSNTILSRNADILGQLSVGPSKDVVINPTPNLSKANAVSGSEKTYSEQVFYSGGNYQDNYWESGNYSPSEEGILAFSLDISMSFPLNSDSSVWLLYGIKDGNGNVIKRELYNEDQSNGPVLIPPSITREIRIDANPNDTYTFFITSNSIQTISSLKAVPKRGVYKPRTWLTSNGLFVSYSSNHLKRIGVGEGLGGSVSTKTSWPSVEEKPFGSLSSDFTVSGGVASLANEYIRANGGLSGSGTLQISGGRDQLKAVNYSNDNAGGALPFEYGIAYTFGAGQGRKFALLHKKNSKNIYAGLQINNSGDIAIEELYHTGNSGKFYDIQDPTGYYGGLSGDLDNAPLGTRGLVSSESNRPPHSGFADVVTISQYGSNDGIQIEYPFRGNQEFNFRSRDGGTYNSWRKVWHDGNLNVNAGNLESINQNLGTGDDVEFDSVDATGDYGFFALNSVYPFVARVGDGSSNGFNLQTNSDGDIEFGNRNGSNVINAILHGTDGEFEVKNKLTADSIYTDLLYAELFKKDITEVINGRLAVGNATTIISPSSEKDSSRARVFPKNTIFDQGDYIHISGEDENGVYNLYGRIQETGAGYYYYAVYTNGSQWQGGFDRVKEGDTIMKVNGNLILMESNNNPYIGIYEHIDSINYSPFNDNHSALTTLLGGLGNVPASANWGAQLHGTTEEGLWTSGAWLEDAHVKGEIKAEEGYLNNLDVTGTLTFPNPYSSSVDGKISSSGIDLVYNGSQSQEISWYGGLGSDVLNLSADNDGGQVHSDFDLNLSAPSINIGSNPFDEVHFKGETHTDRAFYINDRFILENVSTVTGQNNTYYSIGGASLVYMTVGNNEPYIYKIENPQDGEIVRIMANGNGPIHVVDINNTPSGYYGNIKLQSGTVDIYGQTYRTFIYYDGYWRLSADYGS